MTTLFNAFCPIFMNFELAYSMLLFALFTFCFWALLMMVLFKTPKLKDDLSFGLFPLSSVNMITFLSGFVLVSGLNLSSLFLYSFPVTTCFSFNMSIAFWFWLASSIFLIVKPFNLSTFLPANSPWYLCLFLCLVELVSISVRPITLCFRLLANMSAGHILLSLICKISMGLWTLGVLFGLLEIMVCVVQSFVFFMLISVYLEESTSH